MQNQFKTHLYSHIKQEIASPTDRRTNCPSTNPSIASEHLLFFPKIIPCSEHLSRIVQNSRNKCNVGKLFNSKNKRFFLNLLGWHELLFQKSPFKFSQWQRAKCFYLLMDDLSVVWNHVQWMPRRKFVPRILEHGATKTHWLFLHDLSIEFGELRAKSDGTSSWLPDSANLDEEHWWARARILIFLGTRAS